MRQSKVSLTLEKELEQKKPLTPLTSQVNKPVEGLKRVNSLNKASFTLLPDVEEFGL
jgi:hypothetical protein